MNWSKTPRILLVLPRRKKIDLNKLDLKLIQRHAKNLGAELGLVTKSRRIIRAANELNIPVFSTNLSAQHSSWVKEEIKKHPRRRKKKNLRQWQAEVHPAEAKWREHPAVRLSFSALAALAILSLAFAFIPSAIIQIQPPKRILSLTIPVRADESLTQVYISGGIPAQRKSVILTGDETLRASGQKRMPLNQGKNFILHKRLTPPEKRPPCGQIGWDRQCRAASPIQ